jgi:Co/Zn/Cd efflux system component
VGRRQFINNPFLEIERLTLAGKRKPRIADKMAWSKSTRIIIMLAIDAAFFILELGVGLAVGSLALMADAFHMVRGFQGCATKF